MQSINNPFFSFSFFFQKTKINAMGGFFFYLTFVGNSNKRQGSETFETKKFKY